MISAKEACAFTHENRSKVMEEVKGDIESGIRQALAAGDFNTEVEYHQYLDSAMQEEVFDYLSALGYDIKHSDAKGISFSWLVD
jgi:hypothetical protein